MVVTGKNKFDLFSSYYTLGVVCYLTTADERWVSIKQLLCSHAKAINTHTDSQHNVGTGYDSGVNANHKPNSVNIHNEDDSELQQNSIQSENINDEYQLLCFNCKDLCVVRLLNVNDSYLCSILCV